MIKQTKGKDLSKVPPSKLLTDDYFASIKYDGHYVQIHKIGDEIKFYTSGGKEFYLPNIAASLVEFNKGVSFVIEAEFNYDCEGKLGDRGASAILTTYRTQFAKGECTVETNKEFFRVSDILHYSKRTDHGMQTMREDSPFHMRLPLLDSLYYGGQMINVAQSLGSLEQHLEKSLPTIVKDGYEGLFLKHRDHVLAAGKRVNNAIKLKMRPTADLICVGTTSGEGKYEGMIGGLILQDTVGREVVVGSGMSDEDRARKTSYYIHEIIEIQYEQILDTYIQPTFVAVRNDKAYYD